MKPTRVEAGYKAKYTRKLNEARAKLWRRFKADSMGKTGFIPTILPCEGGVELTYDRGYGITSLKFNNRAETIDWLATLC